jgi:hypothetical protein
MVSWYLFVVGSTSVGTYGCSWLTVGLLDFKVSRFIFYKKNISEYFLTTTTVIVPNMFLHSSYDFNGLICGSFFGGLRLPVCFPDQGAHLDCTSSVFRPFKSLCITLSNVSPKVPSLARSL